MLQKILQIVEAQNRWRRTECINLVASENLMSPLAERVYLSDFMSRYNEHDGEPHYHGTRYAMEIEEVVKGIFKERFGTEFVELRPLSGGMANAIAFRALAKPGDVIISPGLVNGAHVSMTKYGVAGMLGLNEVPAYFDADDFVLDVDKTVELVERVNPKFIVLGRSVILFPEPVRELRDSLGDIPIVYDASHVFGLIWGEEFQQPLAEGATLMTASTHKTFPGPQGGVIIGNPKLDGRLWKKVERTAFPGFVYNHHIHRLPALGITALEMNEFGREYASQVVKNARRLAEELSSAGFKVLAPHKGYTASHQVLVDVRELGGGRKVADVLEKNNIIVTKIALPWDKPKDATGNPSGIRIGVQELTRLGMREGEMDYVAELISRVLLEGKNVKEEVVEFRRKWREVAYCFSSDAWGERLEDRSP